MAYKTDSDLDFLRNIKSNDLNELVYVLTHDKDGETRFTEELTGNETYKKYYPDHNKYWQEIAGELQCYGGNTLMTLLRGGRGVFYKEILEDVCDKMKVNYNKKSSTEKIEDNLLMKILEDSLEKMSPEEIKELGETIGVKNINTITPQIMLGIFQTVFKAGGFKSYQLTLIIANAIMKALFSKGFTLATNATITRTMAILTGPIGWAITSLWTIIDIASPAYRVTIPAVIQVAYLRKKNLYANLADEIEFN